MYRAEREMSASACRPTRSILNCAFSLTDAKQRVPVDDGSVKSIPDKMCEARNGDNLSRNLGSWKRYCQSLTADREMSGNRTSIVSEMSGKCQRKIFSGNETVRC